jgi:hypothetical protein
VNLFPDDLRLLFGEDCEVMEAFAQVDRDDDGEVLTTLHEDSTRYRLVHAVVIKNYPSLEFYTNNWLIRNHEFYS